jgi:hypothetical protein
VYQILHDCGIKTTQTPEFDVTSLSSISVKIVKSKGKVEAQNTEIKKAVRFIEKQRNKAKIMVVANTYKELLPRNRANKQHLDPALKLFFETNNTIFMTTLSLYNLYKKVNTNQISIHEASTLIQNETGEITI